LGNTCRRCHLCDQLFFGHYAPPVIWVKLRDSLSPTFPGVPLTRIRASEHIQWVRSPVSSQPDSVLQEYASHGSSSSEYFDLTLAILLPESGCLWFPEGLW